MKNKKGFTLVEVIVVLVILAILAAILIPSLTGWIDDSQKKACLVNAHEVRRDYQALALHYLYNPGATPPTQAAVLGEAAAEYGGKGLTDTTYTASCGGTITVTYNKDKSEIVTAKCSIHGDLFDVSGEMSDDELAGSLAQAVKDVTSSGKTFANRNAYSGTGDANNTLILNQLSSSAKAALAGKTWAIFDLGKTSQKIYIYDGTLTSADVNKKVNVTIMDASGNVTTGTKYAGTVSIGGVTYYCLTQY